MKECLDSVLEQTYANFEICIADDHSTNEDTIKTLKEYEKIDKRIKVVHKENGGVGSARNEGLDIAKGEYIGFVDPDDYIHPEMYQVLLTALQRSEADISMCRALFVWEDGKTQSEIPIHKKDFLYHDNTEYIKDAAITKDVTYSVIWNKLFKKDTIGTIRFDTKFTLGEDIKFVLDVFQKPLKIQFCNKELYYYLQRNDSATKRRSISFFLQEYTVRKRLYDMASKNNSKLFVPDIFGKLVFPSAYILAVLLVLFDNKNQYQRQLEEIEQLFKQNLPKITKREKYRFKVKAYLLGRHFKTTVKILRLPVIKQMALCYVKYRWKIK